jgi:hypothetical protein
VSLFGMERFRATHREIYELILDAREAPASAKGLAQPAGTRNASPPLHADDARQPTTAPTPATA